jgi:hypothetical protein
LFLGKTAEQENPGNGRIGCQDRKNPVQFSQEQLFSGSHERINGSF